MTNDLIIRDEESWLEFHWNGTHTVNVYNGLLQNVDCFSIGDFAKDTASLEEFRNGVARYVADWVDGLKDES